MAASARRWAQSASLDCGIFAHQICTTPNDDAAILVCRGNDKTKDKPEDPGSLKFFSFKDGQLANRVTVAPDGGFGFGPRHLEFHPKLPFVYVSRERENKLNVYRLVDGVIDPQALFVKETLAAPEKIVSRQSACTLHAHPNGRFLYLANRAFDSVKVDGKDVFPGGENNIAVFSIDQTTGEPTAIQHEDVRGIYPRTFALDPRAHVDGHRRRNEAGARPHRRDDHPRQYRDLQGRRRRQAHLHQQLRDRHRRQPAVLERHGERGVSTHRTFHIFTVVARVGGRSSTPRPLHSITNVSGILDHPPSRSTTDVVVVLFVASRDGGRAGPMLHSKCKVSKELPLLS